MATVHGPLAPTETLPTNESASMENPLPTANVQDRISSMEPATQKMDATITPPSVLSSSDEPIGPNGVSTHPHEKDHGGKDEQAQAQENKPQEAVSSTPKEVDRYKFFATRLASKATEEEINFIATQIDALHLRKTALEGFLEETKKGCEEESAKDAVENELAQVTAIPELKLLEWDDFVNPTWCDCTPFNEWRRQKEVQRQPYAIEVLQGHARYPWQKDKEDFVQVRKATALESLKDESEIRKLGRLPEVPERIRINSKPILRLIWDLLGTPDSNPCIRVMVRPYKILVHHEKDIRKRYEELGRKWAHQAATTDGSSNSFVSTLATQGTVPATKEDIAENHSNPPSEKGLEAGNADHPESTNQKENPGKEHDVNDSAEAWRDIGCLVHFLDKHILPAIRDFQGDEVKKVRFSDLWYLFRPGDDILINDTARYTRFSSVKQRALRSSDKHRYWRIYHLTGGRPCLSKPTPEFPTMPGDLPWEPADVTVSPFTIRAYRIIYDGQTYGTISRVFTIQPFQGEKEITNLEIIPLRSADNKDAILKYLEESGRSFTQLEAVCAYNYKGPTLNVDHAGYHCTPAGDSTTHITGQVVVDFEEARQADPSWFPGHSQPTFLTTTNRECEETATGGYVTCWKDDERKEPVTQEIHIDIYFDDQLIDQKRSEEFFDDDKFFSAYKASAANPTLDSSSLSERDLLLLPQHVCAFILKRRQFALLGTDGLRSFTAQDYGWTELKLPKGHKDMVEAQALSHFRDKERKVLARQHDLIPGKGQGLVMLLHGFPGVGKTSTAECIAAKLGNPLYPITCGDLGTTVETVEKRLEEIFSKAQKWDCVLLLDEADVFLAERTKTDIERNALVSLFLRTLEYYDGLLFLTTNRVGTLDEAFRSRIHVTLYYPPLGKAQTEAIWQVNLKRIQSYRDDVDPNIKEILEFPRTLWNDIEREGRTQWNGRQIRNAFQTALALAENDFFRKHPDDASREGKKILLDHSHFRTVAHTINTFDDYLGVAHHGNSDSKRAYDRGQRADNYGQQRPRPTAPLPPPPQQQPYSGYYQYVPPPGPPAYAAGGAPRPPSPNPQATQYDYNNHPYPHPQPPQDPRYLPGFPAPPPSADPSAFGQPQHPWPQAPPQNQDQNRHSLRSQHESVSEAPFQQHLAHRAPGADEFD